MPTPAELEVKFWKALKSDMTMMLGLDGVEDGHARPMTAQLDGERGPIWFFTAKDNAIVQRLAAGNRAVATFVSRGHDLFATIHGSLRVEKAVGPKKTRPRGEGRGRTEKIRATRTRSARVRYKSRTTVAAQGRCWGSAPCWRPAQRSLSGTPRSGQRHFAFRRY